MRRLCRGHTRDRLGRGWGWVRKRWYPHPKAPDKDTGLGPSGELGSENVEKAQDPPSWLRRQHFIHLLFVLTANSRPRKGRRSSLGEKDGGERSLGPPQGPGPGPRGTGRVPRLWGTEGACPLAVSAAGTGELGHPWMEAGPPWVPTSSHVCHGPLAAGRGGGMSPGSGEAQLQGLSGSTPGSLSFPDLQSRSNSLAETGCVMPVPQDTRVQ